MAPMIGELPPAYREAVTLPDLEGVNQADAAARAGVARHRGHARRQQRHGKRPFHRPRIDENQIGLEAQPSGQHFRAIHR
jgi:hypothetical protein